MSEHKKNLTWLEGLLILLVLTAAYFTGLDKVKFHPDESHWIGLSEPYEKFTSGYFEREYWQSLPMTYVNPVMTYYVIGMARQVGGYAPQELNQAYEFTKSYEENLVDGRIPEPGLLWWARAAVTVCSILALFLAFVLFKQAAGRPLAYTWLAFALVNPYLREMLRRAMNEGVLLLFIMLGLWLGYKALLHFTADEFSFKNYRFLAYLIFSGIAAGLAAQTKINGGMLVFGLWAAFAAASLRKPEELKIRCWQVSLVGILLAIASLTAYIGTNPSLWGNPVSVLGKVVGGRIRLMEIQAANQGNQRMVTIEGRFAALSSQIFSDNAIFPSMLPNGFFFVAGAILGVKKMRDWTKGSSQNHALVILLVVGTLISLPAFASPMDWPRYFLLPSFFFGLVSMLGLGLIVGWLRREVGRSDLDKAQK